MNRLLDTLDQWAHDTQTDVEVEPPERFEPTRIPSIPTLNLDFEKQEFKTVIWATGFRPDYNWLNLPVLNRKGKLIHRHGVVGTDKSNTPGLYAMGLSFMRQRKSSFIYGANDDAHYIANAISQHLSRAGLTNMHTSDKAHPAQIANNYCNSLPLAS